MRSSDGGLLVSTSFMLVGICLVAPPTAAGAPVRAPFQELDDRTELGADEVAQIFLDARDVGPSTKALAEALASDGGPALPRLFDTLCRGRFDVRVGERGTSTKALEPDERRALVAAVGRLPWDEVRTFLADRRAEEPTRAQRLAALELLGAHGTTRDLSALLDWSEPDDRRARVPRAVRGAFTEALGGVLDRDERVLRQVPGLYSAAHLSLLPSILNVLGARPSPPTLSTLAELLGVVPKADALVLAEIAHAAQGLRQPADAGTRGRVRAYLYTERGPLTEGIMAAGKLEDAAAVPRLVELLAHADPSVRERAHAALAQITSQRIGPDPQAWTDWHAEAMEWWRDRAPADLRRVRSAGPAVAAQAVLDLSKQRFFRHRLAGPLSYGLEREHEDLVVLTCAALGHLGSPLAVEPLLGSLEDPSVEVRRAAFLALRRLTGEDHGEDPRAWVEAGW